MTEHPILFQGNMVRALLAGTKTQTRRAVKGVALEWLQPENFTPEFVALPENHLCPYGQPGERLWVRETYFAFGRWETRFSEKKGRDEWHFVDMTLELGLAYRYAADSDELPHMLGRKTAGASPMWWKRPAIFMPRAACRTLLDLAGARVQRLQDISEPDAIEEGYPRDWKPGGAGAWSSPCQWYADLWKDINGDDSWEPNPWVWVLEFRRVQS